MARPIPLLEPVTTATWPERSNSVPSLHTPRAIIHRMGFVTYAILLELSTQPSGRHVEAGRNDAEYVIGSHIIVRDILIKPVLRRPSACYGEAVYVIS